MDQSESISGGISLGYDAQARGGEGALSYGTTPFAYSYHDRRGITFATVGEGAIRVRDVADGDVFDFRALNRNADDAQRLIRDQSFELNLPAIELSSLSQNLQDSREFFAGLSEERARQNAINQFVRILEQDIPVTEGALLASLEQLNEEAGGTYGARARLRNSLLNQGQQVSRDNYFAIWARVRDVNPTQQTLGSTRGEYWVPSQTHFTIANRALNRAIQQSRKRANGVIDHIYANGTVPQGVRGGQTFHNDGRGGSQILPTRTQIGNLPVTYREYDVFPRIPNTNRGTSRVVVGFSGNQPVSAYYTHNHYRSFEIVR